MCLNILFLFVLLLSNGCFSKVTVKVNSNNIDSIGEFQQQIQIEKICTRIKFSDLNEDVLHVLFNGLYLTELLIMAEVDSKCNSIAKSTFHRRFRDHTIEIVRTDDRPDPNKFRIMGTSIEIYDYDFARNILRHFGHSIQKLYVGHFNLDDERSAAINKIINENVSDAVNSLNLGIIKNHTLEQYTGTFEKVQDFSCSIRTKMIGTNIRSFNQIFPNLRQITLTLRFNLEYKFIDCELPHLESVDLTIQFNDVNEQIDGFFKKNSQIRSINLHAIPADYVRHIIQLLPKLQNITLNEFCDANESIHLENVQNFQLISSTADSIDKLSFPRIESISMSYREDFFEIWIAFFKRHSNLSKLTLKTMGLLDDTDFVELVAELPNLFELIFDTYKAVGADVIMKIIENHDQLNVFEFSADGFRESDMSILQHDLENVWIIQQERPNFVTLKKQM